MSLKILKIIFALFFSVIIVAEMSIFVYEIWNNYFYGQPFKGGNLSFLQGFLWVQAGLLLLGVLPSLPIFFLLKKYKIGRYFYTAFIASILFIFTAFYFFGVPITNSDFFMLSIFVFVQFLVFYVLFWYLHSKMHELFYWIAH